MGADTIDFGIDLIAGAASGPDAVAQLDRWVRDFAAAIDDLERATKHAQHRQPRVVVDSARKAI